MTTKMIIIIAIAVLATVGTYLFGKMAEKNDYDYGIILRYENCIFKRYSRCAFNA